MTRQNLTSLFYVCSCLAMVTMMTSMGWIDTTQAVVAF